eukprot:1167489_1
MKRSREKYRGEPAGRQTCLPLVLDQTGRDTQSDDDDGICSNSLSIVRPRLALLALMILAATLASVVRVAPLSANSLSRRYYHSHEENSQPGGDWKISSTSTIANKNMGKEQIFIDEIDE